MNSTVRVSNLPPNFDASMLEDMFTMVGDVRSAKVLCDAVSGKSRGLGLVEMSTEDEAQNCVRYFDGQVHDDHALVVQPNRAHIPQPPIPKKKRKI